MRFDKMHGLGNDFVITDSKICLSQNDVKEFVHENLVSDAILWCNIRLITMSFHCMSIFSTLMVLRRKFAEMLYDVWDY